MESCPVDEGDACGVGKSDDGVAGEKPREVVLVAMAQFSGGMCWRARGGRTQSGRVLILEKAPWFARASRRRRWLVGVSGGADSVALLHFLMEAGFSNLVVCHLDHGLRGRAAVEDAKFVKRLCRNLGVACETGRADVLAEMNLRGESMETAARHARHEFFSECAKIHRCRDVLLAHHADDQAETVLWNLLRGSHGLKGMADDQEIVTGSGGGLRLIRPLLALRRADLVEWLRLNGHAWREDASNAQPVAVRNRLRNECIPLLGDVSKRDPVPALVRAAEDFAEMEEVMEWVLEQANLLDPQGRLHLPALRKLPPALQRAALHQFMKSHDIGSLDRDLVARAAALLEPDGPPAVNLPGGRRLRRREGRLWIDL